jgi:hypothetical protein
MANGSVFEIPRRRGGRGRTGGVAGISSADVPSVAPQRDPGVRISGGAVDLARDVSALGSGVHHMGLDMKAAEEKQQKEYDKVKTAQYENLHDETRAEYTMGFEGRDLTNPETFKEYQEGMKLITDRHYEMMVEDGVTSTAADISRENMRGAQGRSERAFAQEVFKAIDFKRDTEATRTANTFGRLLVETPDQVATGWSDWDTGTKRIQAMYEDADPVVAQAKVEGFQKKWLEGMVSELARTDGEDEAKALLRDPKVKDLLNAKERAVLENTIRVAANEHEEERNLAQAYKWMDTNITGDLTNAAYAEAARAKLQTIKDTKVRAKADALLTAEIGQQLRVHSMKVRNAHTKMIELINSGGNPSKAPADIAGLVGRDMPAYHALYVQKQLGFSPPETEFSISAEVAWSNMKDSEKQALLEAGLETQWKMEDREGNLIPVWATLPHATRDRIRADLVNIAEGVPDVDVKTLVKSNLPPEARGTKKAAKRAQQIFTDSVNREIENWSKRNGRKPEREDIERIIREQKLQVHTGGVVLHDIHFGGGKIRSGFVGLADLKQEDLDSAHIKYDAIPDVGPKSLMARIKATLRDFSGTSYGDKTLPGNPYDPEKVPKALIEHLAADITLGRREDLTRARKRIEAYRQGMEAYPARDVQGWRDYVWDWWPDAPIPGGKAGAEKILKLLGEMGLPKSLLPTEEGDGG